MEWFAQIRKEVKTLRKLINKSRTSHSKRGIMNPLTTGGSVCAKVFDTPQPCYLKVMLWVWTRDAAKKMKWYMTTTVKLAHVVTIVQHSWLNAMNLMLPYLLCLEHMKGSPTNLPIMKTKFSELKCAPISSQACPWKWVWRTTRARTNIFPQVGRNLRKISSLSKPKFNTNIKQGGITGLRQELQQEKEGLHEAVWFNLQEKQKGLV